MILYRHNYFIENRYISTLHMHILDQFLKRRLISCRSRLNGR